MNSFSAAALAGILTFAWSALATMRDERDIHGCYGHRARLKLCTVAGLDAIVAIALTLFGGPALQSGFDRLNSATETVDLGELGSPLLAPVLAVFATPLLSRRNSAREAFEPYGGRNLYRLARERLVDALFDECALQEQARVAADLKLAKRLGMQPNTIAERMRSWIKSQRRLRNHGAERIAEVDACLVLRGSEARLKALLELTYRFRMTKFRESLLPRPD